MNEYTSGSWSVETAYQTNGTKIVVIEAPIALPGLPGAKQVVAEVLGMPRTTEAEANARLMAAAPDLMAALEAMVKDIEAVAKNDVVWPATLKQARAAIAKAKGDV